jgi:hypothetical protein
VTHSLEQLKKLIPTGWHGFLPARPGGADLSRLLEQGLKLPLVVERGHDPEAWMRRARRSPAIKNTGHLRSILEGIQGVLDQGGQPMHRLMDVSFAYWETVLWDEMETLEFRLGTHPDDRKVIVPPQAMEEWLRQHPIEEGTITSLKDIGDQWNPHGVLSAFGYRVGENARKRRVYTNDRRNFLVTMVCTNLGMFGERRAAWWGDAGTFRRARASGAVIATFLGLSRGRHAAGHGDHRQATMDYEEDLKWMAGEWGIPDHGL